MHYIRFLKPPQVTSGILSGKLTITNDLGDAFLSRGLAVEIRTLDAITGEVFSSSRGPLLIHWKAGARELPFSIPLPAAHRSGRSYRESQWRMTLLPYSEDEAVGPEALAQVLGVNRGEGWRRIRKELKAAEGAVLPAVSADFDPDEREQVLPAVVYRKLSYAGGGGDLFIEEETGNSIARHIWDAGVVFSAMMEELVRAKKAPYLEPLHTLLHREESLGVIELGTGCAIVSATLARLKPEASIRATDMPEAQEIASKNLAFVHRQTPSSTPNSPSSLDSQITKPVYTVLDWTAPLPPSIATSTFDLVLVADCTYNSDVVPDLVNTLRRLVDKSPAALIAVALKRRHESEAVFFELMEKKGLEGRGKWVERCGMFDGQVTGVEEEIEVYLFGGRG